MVFELCVLLLVLALCCPADGETEPLFGMGRRHYFGEGRLDIKYTTELATPHIDWADPYVRGPVKAFVVPSVMEGRTLVELMQRLSMDVEAVTIDPAWDTNKWTMSFGEAYGARSERNADGSVDYSFTYKYLEEDLTSDRKWEVMVTHGILGWGHLPEVVRQAILRRVREGMGLVLVGPLADGEALAELGQLSPLTPSANADPPATEHRRWRLRPGEWQAAGAHYITDGVPLEILPSDFLGHGKYALTEGATLLATVDGDPVMAAWEVGKGRVVALGYQNYGLAPYLAWDSYGKVWDAWWETWYSLFIRSILWAAQKEPQERIASFTLEEGGDAVGHDDSQKPLAATVELTSAPEDASLRWQVRDDDGGEVRAAGEAELSGTTASFAIPVPQLDGASYVVDAFLVSGGKRVDWASESLWVLPIPWIEHLTAAPMVVRENQPVRVLAEVEPGLSEGETLAVELVDNYGRVVARNTSPTYEPDVVLTRSGAVFSAELQTDDLLTHIGWVRAAVSRGSRILARDQIQVDFATPERLRVWDDFEVNVPFYGPQNYYHWMPLLDEQYRRCGVTWLMEPQRNFRFTVLARPGGLGVYHYDRKPFDEQIAAYWETGDRKYLERSPCFHRDWRETARSQMTSAMTPYLKYRPFHYYIYDEPSLTSYTRAFEFCFTPETRAAFRVWLRKQYRGLTALNAEWGATYTRWEQVEPVTADEARQKNLIPAWVDFRRFMDITFAEAVNYTQQVVNELDPGALTLVGGTQMPTPFNGTDWWLMSHAFGILEPYSGIPEFTSFNPDLPIIQACGYQEAGPELEEELWRRALQGQRGATVFWNYTMLDPDLALNSQGLAMERAFGALRGEGIARLLLGARRDDSRIAILYSQPSLHVAWIQDGEARSGRSETVERRHRTYFGWQKALHQLGLQYRCISYQQLAEQGLTAERSSAGSSDRRECDLLILPGTMAMSEAEVANVRRFIASGGVVVSEIEPGAWDEHGKRRDAPALTAADGLTVVPASAEGDDFPAAVSAGLREALGRAGIKPPAEVSVGAPELVRFVDGAAEYVAIEDAPAERHQVAFGREAHIYEVRERRYLGKSNHVDSPGGRARVALYALLPEAVGEVEIKVVRQRRVERGGEVEYRLSVNQEARSFRHVFAVHVYGPDGMPRQMYGANVEARKGQAKGSFRLAWNDPAGEWRVVASDAATGVTGEARFVVK